MAATNHPSYGEELERCNYTLAYVEKSLDTALTKKERIDSDVNHIKKHFNSDNSQNYIDLMINTMLQDSLALKIRNLRTARSKPYFARVNFSEKSREGIENLYIGKMSLMRDEDQEVIIVDWRAPIANLYYEGRLGEAAYDSPDGKIQGELLLKRQFSINGGELQEIFDIDITTNDDFLQAYLGASANNRLKEIVSTIQVEQNNIIRADMWTPLIVQGAAGSGKTTIALHRIAYLIYTYEKTFKPENFMIIAPNKLFLNYISEILPELGVERVKQTTFEEFAMELIGKTFKIKDPHEKLAVFVGSNITQEQKQRNDLTKRMSRLKSSMLFKEILDDYIETVEQAFIPEEDFKIDSKVIFKYEEINSLFLNDYKHLPIVQRIHEIKKHLNNRMAIQKDSIINSLHNECDSRVAWLKAAMEDSDERQQLIIQAIDGKNHKIGKMQSYTKKAADEYVRKISRLSPFEYYKDLFADGETFKRLLSGKVDEELICFTREFTEQVIKSGYIEIEDLAPIIYLKFRIYGMDEKIPVRHIVIDEAQDFSTFQLYVLKKIVKDSSFTILGDLSQGIHSYRGVERWDDVTKHVFDDGRSRYLTLEQSYRTTIEIMEAANKVIAKFGHRDLVPAKPVIRHGDKVQVTGKGSLKEIAGDIAGKLQQFKDGNFKSTAVICKSMEECKTMLSHLKGSCPEIYVITGKEKEYKGGIVIVPSHLAKGLEFDAVMVANAGSDVYTEDELDIKLLYVAMTRALHRLYIYYTGKPSPLLEGVDG